MNKHVIISVKGSQISGDYEDEAPVELLTEGKYYKKGSAYYVTYRESTVTGMEGTTTTLKVADDVVTLTRKGTVNSQFIFKKGQKHISQYDTTFGTFTVGVFTNDMDVSLSDKGGELRVEYEIEFKDDEYLSSDFYLTVREAGKTSEYNGKH